jgi:hypothetical protein
VGFRSLTTSVALPEHANEHSSERPIFLAVDQVLRRLDGRLAVRRGLPVLGDDDSTSRGLGRTIRR